MTWYAVVDKATGEAVSFGTILADPLPTDLEAIEIEGQPKKGLRKWDSAARQMVPHLLQAGKSPEEKIDEALTAIEALTMKVDAIDAKVPEKATIKP